MSYSRDLSQQEALLILNSIFQTFSIKYNKKVNNDNFIFGW